MRRPISASALLCAAALAAGLTVELTAKTVPALAGEPEPGLQNPGFEAGLDGWTLATGATTRGDGSTSHVRVEGGALRFSGAGGVSTWPMATQDLPVSPGRRVLLTVRARSKGLRKDAGQYGNANGFLLFRDAKGERVHFATTPVLSGDRAWVTLFAHEVAPETAVSVTVGLFASQTGDAWFDDVVLRVADLSADTPAARELAFDALRVRLERTYPFWGLAGKPDPAKLFASHRAAVVAADGEKPFLAAVSALLAELNDPHLSLRVRGIPRGVAKPHRPTQNWNVSAIKKRMTEVTAHRQSLLTGIVGTGPDAIGYCLIGSFQLYEKDMESLERALGTLAKTRALILDVRANGGGDERIGQRIAGRWAAAETPYAQQRVRDPTLAGLDGFGPPSTRVLVPVGDEPDPRRVIVLQGPYCMSSAEGFLQMAKALPNWTTMGQTSRGASANPKLFPLLTGVELYLSTWQSLDLAGTCIEGVGIAPDHEVDDSHEAADPTLERALELLRAK